MDRLDYQQLRFSVENEIRNAINSVDSVQLDCFVLTNSVMRLLLAAHSSSEVKRQRSKRQFLTFRRSPDMKAPSWAYRKPGIDSRLPTL
jgi:hypothetical protein